MEQAVADILQRELRIELDADFVIVHGFNIQSVKTTSRNDEASIMIDARPEPKPLEQYSPLFQSIQEGYADGSIEVYAPMNWETRAERRKSREKLREPIRSAIESIAKKVLPQHAQQAEQAEGSGA
jgi:hypothetical protein